ncbi:hypothetical protein HDU97_009681 [Phlyctochytrium planicorne]|nr:hypothetical protein HDU97_009681 [Phlyctochytrium planicorne]
MNTTQPSHQDALAGASKDVLSHLHNIPIASLLSHRKARRHQLSTSPALVSVSEEEPVRSVLQIMALHDILALPVYRSPTDAEGNPSGKEFLGIVSIYDIMAWTVFQKVFDKMETASDEAHTADFKRWIEIEDDMNAYFDTAVGTIVGYTSESVVSWTLHSADPISSLLQMLLKYHRMLIIDDDVIIASALAENPDPIPGSAIVMVTQTDLMAWLMDNRDVVAPQSITSIFATPVYEICERVQELHFRDDPNQVERLHVPVTESNIENHHGKHHQRLSGSASASGRTKIQNVVTVPVTFTAIAAFRLMYLHRVSAVAVIEPSSGGLVANLSASDLRGITADRESLGALLLPVFTFLETRTHRNPDQIKADQLRVVTPRDTLSTAVKEMVDNKIHRVWVQGSQDRPVGVLTLTDAISSFLPVDEVATDI